MDASTQAHGLSTLIWELVEQGEILLDSSSCVVFMGLGSGAHAVLDFAVSSFRDSRFKRLRDATRFLTLVNPFPLSLGTDSDCQPARQTLQTLREVLKRGVYHEQLQCLITALFSTDYLEKVCKSSFLTLRMPSPGIVSTWRSVLMKPVFQFHTAPALLKKTTQQSETEQKQKTSSRRKSVVLSVT